MGSFEIYYKIESDSFMRKFGLDRFLVDYC